MRKKNSKYIVAQTAVEYALLVAAVCAVFVSMFVYVRRSVNAKLLIVQDQLNNAVREESHEPQKRPAGYGIRGVDRNCERGVPDHGDVYSPSCPG